MGDVRAGINPVHTFYFSYEDVKARLSIPERIKLKTLNNQENRMEAVINYIAGKDEIPVEAFKQY